MRTLALKVINNNRKKINPPCNNWSYYTANWVGDHSSLQRIKIEDSSKLKRPRFSLTYSFKLTYKCLARLAFHKSYERY